MPKSLYYCVIFGGVLGAPLIGAAQTNSAHPDMQWFVLPTPKLRILSTEPVKSGVAEQKVILNPPAAAPHTMAPKDQLADSLAATSDGEDTDFDPRYRNFVLTKRNFVLTKLSDLESPDRVTRGFEAVFSPEEFRIERTAKFSCVITTAIKRKDPLCLLNPIYFLRISW